MEKLKYKLIITIFLTVFSSQAQVMVQLRQPAPYAFKLEKMWQVTLNNASQQTYSVYLRGVATEMIEGFIVDASTAAFSLPPGVKVVTAADIKPITVNETNKKYEDVVKKVGTVPSGSYDICVYVVDVSTSMELGSDCISTDVLNMTQVELLYPEHDISLIGGAEKKNSDGDEGITLNNSGYIPINFSWLPPYPVSAGQRVTYRLKVVQLYGMQSGYDAMQSNPLYYNVDNLIATIYQYPVAARSISTGKYAWQVEAFVNGVLLSTSEVWEFKTGEVEYISSDASKLKTMKRYWGLNDNGFNSTGSESQTKRKPLMFAFDSKIYGENANRSGTGSDKEPRYGYWEINPSLSIYGLPFSMPILLSSENLGSRQNINQVGLNLDVSVINDFIMERVEREKDKLLEKGKKEVSKLTERQKDKLESDAKGKVMARLNPLLKFMSSFRTLGFGTTYPDYTQLTVRGVPLTGVNVEFNPGLLYIAAGGFKNQKPIDNEAYKRSIYIGRLGIGQKDGSHIYFTGMYAKDDEKSISIDSSNQILTPKANYVFGIDGKLDLFRKKLSLEGEISGAMLTRDTRDADLENKAIPDWVKNTFHPKISSSVDYSYTVKGIFNNEKSATKVTAGVRMLGPGYTSLGVPNLSTDKLEIKSKVEQKLSKKQIGLTGELLWYRDNLIDWKRYTTSVTRFSIGANFRLKGLPYFNIMFAPTLMTNNASSLSDKLDNKFYVSSVFTGHNYKKWDVNFFSSISYFMNSSSNLDSIITENVSVHNLIFSQSLGFSFPLNLSGSFSMSFARYPGEYSRILSGDISVDYTLFDIANSFIGFSTAYEKDLNKKNTFYFGTRLGYDRYINIEVRAEKNLYHDWFDMRNNFDEFLIRGIVSTEF
ncbi:MAG: hypothetical protein L0Y79_12600 [Chlorobi bacterium]|nr:hypothetical protein [Chlorobiota bacterium]MCI0715522.1 hypothetical protein [Chlorobiota bacterium]